MDAPDVGGAKTRNEIPRYDQARVTSHSLSIERLRERATPIQEAAMKHQSSLLRQYEEHRQRESEISALAKQIAEDARSGSQDTARLQTLQDRIRSTFESLNSSTRALHETQAHLDSVEKALAYRDGDLSQDIQPLLTSGAHIGHASHRSESSSNNESEDSDRQNLSPELQTYYDAAGWVGIWRERLDDLRFQHAEQLEDGKLDAMRDRQAISESSKAFEKEESRMLQGLREAKQKATDLLQKCIQLRIDVPHRLLSSNESANSQPMSTVSHQVDRVASPQQDLHFPPTPTTPSPEPEQGPQNLSEHENVDPDQPRRIQTVTWREDEDTFVDVRVLGYHDEQSDLRVLLQTGPPARITDPVFLRAGISAKSKLLPTEGQAEHRLDNYHRQSHPQDYFTVGRVFFVLWAEPAADENESRPRKIRSHAEITDSRISSKTRGFVVIRSSEQYCSCLPVVTHEALSAPDASCSIIYSATTPPIPQRDESVGNAKSGLLADPIRVIAEDQADRLENASRLDYCVVYTVHHNVKVRNFGQVHPQSLERLDRHFRIVWPRSGPLLRSGSLANSTGNISATPSSSNATTATVAQRENVTSATSSSPVLPAQWNWDSGSAHWFSYDARTDHYVFENSERVKRPANHPDPGMLQNSRSLWHSAASRESTSSTATTTQAINYEARPAAQISRVSVSAGQTPSSRAKLDSANVPMQEVTRPTQFEQRPIRQPQSGTSEAVVPYRDAGGIIHAHDRMNGVLTSVQTGPAQTITDPALWKAGIYAESSILETNGDAERLFETFQKRAQPRTFFVVGRVFLTLWTQPAGENSTAGTGLEESTHLGRYGERVFSKIRRFVVIREGHNFSSCLSITTHREQGVAKAGLKKSDFSIIHSSKTPPSPKDNEKPKGGEVGMRPQPVRVSADDPMDKLSAMSRIDYGKVFTVHYNVKVRNFGVVHPGSMQPLLRQFQDVWAKQATRVETQGGDSKARVAVGQQGSYHRQTVLHAPAFVRPQQSQERRDSQLYGGNDQPQGINKSQKRQATPSVASARSKSNERERSGDEESEGDDLPQHARQAGANMIKRGFAKDQSTAAVKKKMAERRAIESDSRDSSSDTYGDSEGNSGGLIKLKKRSRDDTRQNVRASYTRSQPAERTQALSSQKVPGLDSTGFRPPQTHAQTSSMRRSGSLQQQPRSINEDRRPGSTAEQTARTERAEAAIRNYMTQGYSREQAIHHLRAQFEGGRQ